MINKLKKVFDTGFFHIFITNVLNRVIEFSSGIILVRLLSKGDYGIYSYAYNIITIFLLFNGLGMNSGMLQFGSELFNRDDKQKKSIFRYGIEKGVLFDFILAIALIVSGIMFPYKISGSGRLISVMCIYPLCMFLVENVQIYMRVSMKNKEFGNYNLLCSAVGLIMTIAGAVMAGLYGVIFFKYVGFALIFVIGVFYAKDYIDIFKQKIDLKLEERRTYLNYSILVTINNAFSQLLYTIDVFLVGVLIPSSETIASYKSATIIPFGLSFVPLSFAIYIYPYIAGNINNKEKIKKYTHLMVGVLAIINLCISVIMFAFAPNIITIFFGSEYLDSLIVFRILSVGYFFAGTFRIPYGNVLAAMRKVKFNLYLSVVSGILNIVIDYFLIKRCGIEGAAIATCIIYLVTSAAEMLYFYVSIRKGSAA